MTQDESAAALSETQAPRDRAEQSRGEPVGPAGSGVRPSATVIVPTVTPARAMRLLRSLAVAGEGFETIVVDNGTGSSELKRAAADVEGARVLRLESNLGYSRAVNRAAREAQGDVLVMLNDDSLVGQGYVERIASALDPAQGRVMAAGVMCDAGSPEPDRQRRDRARLDPARVRLPERRARRDPGWAGALTHRPLRVQRRVLARGVSRDRRLRRAHLRLPRGRGPGAAVAPGGWLLQAGEDGPGSARALRDARVRIPPQGLPDGLGPRLPAAQVERHHPAQAARHRGAGALPRRGTGPGGPKRRRPARQARRAPCGEADRAVSGAASRPPDAALDAAPPLAAPFPASQPLGRLVSSLAAGPAEC